MDYLYIEKTVPELKELLRGKKIKAIENNEKGLSIFFYGGKTLNVYLGFPNALFVGEEGEFSGFHSFNQIRGLILKEVKLPVEDRVLELELVKLSLSGKIKTFYLILELTGKTANAFLLEESRKIIASLKKVETTVRNLKIGETYQFPPNEKREFTDITFGTVTEEGIEKNFHKFVRGISPLNAKEIAYLFSKTKDLKIAFEIFLEKHKNSKAPWLYWKEEKLKYLTTFPYESLEGLKKEKVEGTLPFLNGWRLFYERVVKEEEEKQKRKKAVENLERCLTRLKKELSEIKEPERFKEEALRYKKMGELLKINLHKVKKGMEKVELKDYGTGEKITIPLDPSLTPKENLELLFRKYKKLLGKYENSLKRVKELKEEIEKKEKVLELVKEGKLLPSLIKKKKRTENSLPIKIFTLPSGKKLLVGENARGNEILTFKVARPWDLWFHVKGTPGSHVVLMREKGEELEEEEILTAASAAVFFSKGKNTKRLPVDYTEVKNVKKVPNSKKGFVIYKGEKTVTGSSDFFEELIKNSGE